ncbi:Tol-Pal system beta propeller repeat protein TolB [Legionella clemsonensis]|uniref:Tol-Pal system beta propeller repeat protein TolB n=1 Tax=Legionella clemsonensis TaxID=1867846 RepID=UPI001E42AE51|nr:Tol-Pal system beta propeller repeat protein TolB [Legionella clemsonensis]
MKRFITPLFLLLSTTVFAVDLELTQGINSALPIGIDSFGSDSFGQQLSEIVNNDLKFSGQFKVIPPPNPNDQSSITSWRQIGADSVLSGNIRRTGYNRYEVSYELADAVAHGRVLLSKSYQISSNELRPLAHHISDEVYQKLTGERGIFSTRIAYILVQRNGEKAKYFLEVADVDGYNPQSLLVSTEPVMSPAWSPDGRQIAYVSFEKKKAQIFTVDVATGRRRLVTDFTGINGAPAWSPDGRQLAVVLSKSGAAKIYSVDLATGNMKQLTFGEAIDTEPRYSPDGRSLLFTSGRGGAPQVYRLSLADGKVSRVTYEGNYNARASYTPDQKYIVMLHREDKSFNIAVQDESGHVSQLTFAPMDESPSVSPNGRLILYATRHNEQGVLGVVSIDGRIKLRLPAREGDVQEPAWSPYLG